MDHIKILDKIFELRKKAGINQKKFAKMMDVQPNTVSRWDRKKNVPLPMALRRMEEILRSRPRQQEEKKGFGRLEVLLKFMQKRREERNNGIGEKNK